MCRVISSHLETCRERERNTFNLELQEASVIGQQHAAVRVRLRLRSHGGKRRVSDFFYRATAAEQ